MGYFLFSFLLITFLIKESIQGNGPSCDSTPGAAVQDLESQETYVELPDSEITDGRTHLFTDQYQVYDVGSSSATTTTSIKEQVYPNSPRDLEALLYNYKTDEWCDIAERDVLQRMCILNYRMLKMKHTDVGPRCNPVRSSGEIKYPLNRWKSTSGVLFCDCKSTGKKVNKQNFFLIYVLADNRPHHENYIHLELRGNETFTIKEGWALYDENIPI